MQNEISEYWIEAYNPAFRDFILNFIYDEYIYVPFMADSIQYAL